MTATIVHLNTWFCLLLLAGLQLWFGYTLNGTLETILLDPGSHWDSLAVAFSPSLTIAWIARSFATRKPELPPAEPKPEPRFNPDKGTV